MNREEGNNTTWTWLVIVQKRQKKVTVHPSSSKHGATAKPLPSSIRNFHHGTPFFNKLLASLIQTPPPPPSALRRRLGPKSQVHPIPPRLRSRKKWPNEESHSFFAVRVLVLCSIPLLLRAEMYGQGRFIFLCLLLLDQDRFIIPTL